MAEAAVEAHPRHGDQLGRWGLLGGTQTCQGAKLPCNTNPTFFREACACFVTTTGGSICASNSIDCRAGGTCETDDDCVSIYGYACVPTFGCDVLGCTDTGNACAGPCQG